MKKNLLYGLFLGTILCNPYRGEAKRTPPPSPPIISYKDMKYKVIYERNLEKRTFKAFLQSESLSSQHRLQKIPLYEVHYVKDLETDVQDIFVKEIQKQDSFLYLWTEQEGLYRVDLKNSISIPVLSFKKLGLSN